MLSGSFTSFGLHVYLQVVIELVVLDAAVTKADGNALQEEFVQYSLLTTLMSKNVIMASPSINSPLKYPESFTRERDAMTASTVAFSSCLVMFLHEIIRLVLAGEFELSLGPKSKLAQPFLAC